MFPRHDDFDAPQMWIYSMFMFQPRIGKSARPWPPAESRAALSGPPPRSVAGAVAAESLAPSSPRKLDDFAIH